MEGGGEGGGVNPTDLPYSEVEMRDPFLEELPSNTEDVKEMKEWRRNREETIAFQDPGHI